MIIMISRKRCRGGDRIMKHTVALMIFKMRTKGSHHYLFSQCNTAFWIVRLKKVSPVYKSGLIQRYLLLLAHINNSPHNNFFTLYKPLQKSNMVTLIYLANKNKKSNSRKKSSLYYCKLSFLDTDLPV